MGTVQPRRHRHGRFARHQPRSQRQLHLRSIQSRDRPILPELMTFYAGYSEANRLPTPLELGCSNPQSPVCWRGFLVSDPPLQQVVAKTVEAGFRGNINTGSGRGDWKLGLFHTDSQNDIIQVASVIQGRGVFQNVPLTRRQGLEAGANYQTGQYLVYA